MILTTHLEQGLPPDLVDDTNPDDIYLGFFKYNAGANPAHCLIKRITKATIDGKVITKVRYPYGRFEWAYSWASRKTISDWRYRDFPCDFDPIGLGYWYNWHVLADMRGIAPAGFHLPTLAEMTIWGNGGNNPGENYRLNTSKCDPLGWYREYFNEANNMTGFSAVPAGWRWVGNDAVDVTKRANFWCTHDGGVYGRYGSISYNNYMQLCVESIPKKSGLSIRFVKNTNVFDPTEIVHDVDGNSYGTCRPNVNQVWTSSNYKGTKFNNGDEIPTVSDDTIWNTLEIAAKCAPLNNERNV